MVSLEQRQALAALSESNQHLKRFQMLLAGDQQPGGNLEAGEIRECLLAAISANDAAQFKETAAKIGQRKISADSDWCNDDYLLFLLLLGNDKFGRPLNFLSRVIEVRGNNPNPIPRKINEIFGALDRQEFGMDGELFFLKIPFLHLSGKLRLDGPAARKALQEMSDPKLFEQLSPFMKLLTLKAYDLVLTERQPMATETTTQLIEGFEAHAKNLSMRQWLRVVTALPGRLILAIVGIVLGLGLIPVLFGFGKQLADNWKPNEIRIRPSTITVARLHDSSSGLPSEALALARTLLPQTNAPGGRHLLITVEGDPFPNATPPFVVEVSHAQKPILNAFAFTHSPGEASSSFTIVPVQRDAGRFRAVLPEQAKGQAICFVLAVEGQPSEEVSGVGRGIILRPLQ
jgi:hypothetical protein